MHMYPKWVSSLQRANQMVPVFVYSDNTNRKLHTAVRNPGRDFFFHQKRNQNMKIRTEINKKKKKKKRKLNQVITVKKLKPAIAAMHGPHSLVRLGD